MALKSSAVKSSSYAGQKLAPAGARPLEEHAAAAGRAELHHVQRLLPRLPEGAQLGVGPGALGAVGAVSEDM